MLVLADPADKAIGWFTVELGYVVRLGTYCG